MSQKGTVLVESLIALGAAVIIIAAITGMVISALNNAQSAKSQHMASQYAQEGLEIVRNLARTNWEFFHNTLVDTNYCLASGSAELTFMDESICGENVGTFVRKIVIDHDSDYCSGASKVEVDVSWTNGECRDRTNPYCHTVQLQSCLSNLGVVPSP